MVLLAALIPALSVSAAEPWQEAYANYLRENTDGYDFALHDMDGDGIPELFTGYSSFTFRGGTMIDIRVGGNRSATGIDIPMVDGVQGVFMREPRLPQKTTRYTLVNGEVHWQDVYFIDVEFDDDWEIISYEDFAYIEDDDIFVGEDDPRFNEAAERWRHKPLEFYEITEANIQRIIFAEQATPPVTSQTPNAVSVTINGALQNFEVAPQIIDGRTMLPLRAIGEALGMNVNFDRATNTATLTTPNKTITHVIHTADIMVNGTTSTFDVPSTIIDGRTLVPLRMLAEAIGAEVQWDSATRTASITTN
jgi:hypothetical protein